jgi:hypothetical protein
MSAHENEEALSSIDKKIKLKSVPEEVNSVQVHILTILPYS